MLSILIINILALQHRLTLHDICQCTIYFTFCNFQVHCLKSSGSKASPYATLLFKISYKIDPSIIISIIQWFSKLCGLVKVGKKFNLKVAEGITSDHHDFNYDLSCLSCSALWKDRRRAWQNVAVLQRTIFIIFVVDNWLMGFRGRTSDV